MNRLLWLLCGFLAVACVDSEDSSFVMDVSESSFALADPNWKTTSAPPRAALLIVTSDALEGTPNLDEFVAHKKRHGISAYVVTVSSMVLTEVGVDVPEKIKHGIAWAEEHLDTRYVMLAGDVTHVPARHHRVVADNNPTYLGTTNPTDLYYSDLWESTTEIADWDANDDGFYNDLIWDSPQGASENPDNVVAFPMVALGRVPAADQAQLAVYLDKVMAYENDPGLSASIDVSYFADYQLPEAVDLANVIESGSPPMPSRHYGFGFPPNGLPPGYMPGDAQTVISEAQLSDWIVYVGHGSPFAWAPGTGFGMVDVMNLNNTQNFPIVFAASCETGQFSPPTYVTPEIGWNPSQSVGTTPQGSIGNAWILVPSGAIAYFGETVVKPDFMAAEFATYLMTEKANRQILGDAYLYAQQEYWRQNYSSSDILAAPRIYLGIMNLFGDPSLRYRRDNASMVNAAVGAQGVLSINDRVQVRSPNPSVPGTVINACSPGTPYTNIGVQAVVGSIGSDCNVFLRNYSSAQDIRYSDHVYLQIGATFDVANSVYYPNGYPLPKASDVLAEIEFPDDHNSCGATPYYTPTWVSVENNQILGDPEIVATTHPNATPISGCNIDNGAVTQNVSVKTGGILALGPGSYYFESLQIEPGAYVVLDNAAGPIRIYIRNGFTSRSLFGHSSKSHHLFVGVMGGSVNIENEFNGTLAAPWSYVNMAPKTYSGAFFGKNVTIHQDSVINQVRFLYSWYSI